MCLFGIGFDLLKNLWVLRCHIVKLLDILTKIIKLKGCIFVGLNRLPVVDADGNLIGLAFDTTWEGTMSDLYFDADIVRSIMVDIRYVLFIIDKYAGAKNVVITDINPKRLALAKTLGATRTVDVRSEKLADVQRQLGMSEGFDVGLEMSGNPAGFRDLLANMCHGGKVAILGIPGEEMAIDWSQVIFNMLTLKGIYGREMYETWYKMSSMIESGLNISSVITHRLGYEDFQQGFDAMNAGEASKVILNWK